MPVSQEANVLQASVFVDRFLNELRENNAAVFVGAGMSRVAGFVDWAGLLANVASDLGLDVTREQDLVSVGQYYVNDNAGNRHGLNQLLIDEFSDLPEPSENHKILARLPIRTYWTTNYDRLIEKALEAVGKRVDFKYINEQLATTRYGHDVILYKMHGDIERPDIAVLTKDDYEKYHLTHGPFINALSGHLVDTTFLFLGFSFSDPNLDYILSRIRVSYREHQRRHYCVTKRRTRQPGETEADFEYQARRQLLTIADLRRFNINTVLVNDYADITNLLQQIENRFRRCTVFISGSANDYGSWGKEATENFVARLASELINKNYRITTGFGLGIGGPLIAGAVQQIYSSRRRSIEDQLVIRPFWPFPLEVTNTSERQRTFNRYREELISQAGIGVFILGNRVDASGATVNADGVRAEFRLARELGLYLIPIGASGFIAKELWNEVEADLATYYPAATDHVRDLLQQIGAPVAQPIDVLDPLLLLIDELGKE